MTNFIGENSKFINFIGILSSKSSVKLGLKIKFKTTQVFLKVDFLDKKWRFGAVCSKLGIARSFAFQVGFFLEISAKNGNIFVKNENDGFKSWKFYFWCQVEWKGAVEQIFEFMNFWWWQRAYHRYWRILHFLNLKIFKINWLFYLHILILASDDLGGGIWGHLNSCFRVGCFCLMKKIIISSEDFLLGWALFLKIGIPFFGPIGLSIPDLQGLQSFRPQVLEVDFSRLSNLSLP